LYQFELYREKIPPFPFARITFFCNLAPEKAKNEIKYARNKAKLHEANRQRYWWLVFLYITLNDYFLTKQ
jgi:hypothetical protein